MLRPRRSQFEKKLVPRALELLAQPRTRDNSRAKIQRGREQPVVHRHRLVGQDRPLFIAADAVVIDNELQVVTPAGGAAAGG